MWTLSVKQKTLFDYKLNSDCLHIARDNIISDKNQFNRNNDI